MNRYFAQHYGKYYGAIALAVGLVFASVAAAEQARGEQSILLVQQKAVDRVCTVPYRLRADDELHIHCYTTELIGTPTAFVATGAALVTGTLVSSYDKPPGVWVVLRGKGYGVARITLVPGP